MLDTVLIGGTLSCEAFGKCSVPPCVWGDTVRLNAEFRGPGWWPFHVASPDGPSTLYLRTLVPNTIKSMVVGARDLKYCVLGSSGFSLILKASCSTLKEISFMFRTAGTQKSKSFSVHIHINRR